MNIGIIPYSNILSLVIQKYINDNNDSFLKEENRYILVKPFKINIMHSLIADTITSSISQMHQNVFYIVGECYHYNNWRMHLEYNQITNGCKSLIDNKAPIKYILKERDIKIDELMLNHIADTYFNTNFKKQSNIIKFIKNKYLTEDDILYIFKQIYSEKILNFSNINNTSLLKINDLIYSTKSDKIDKKYIKNISSFLEQMEK